MHVSDLIIEITRRCNMRCQHCLRGPAQRLDIQNNTLFNVFSQIDSVGTLTLTGGEPSLKPEIIDRIVQELHYQKVSMELFYVATNAHSTYKRVEFIEALERLHWIAESPSECALVVSQDQFHKQEHTPNFKYYDGGEDWKGMYDEYMMIPDFVHLESRKEPITEPINDGYARSLGWGVREEKKPKTWVTEDYNDDLTITGDRVVNISANGNVMSSGNMSYARVDELCHGNVNQKPLREIIESNCMTQEQYESNGYKEAA